MEILESIYLYLTSQDMNFYIAQGFSVLNGIIGVITMQMKKMELILLGQLSMNLLSALSFLFLGGNSGGLICLVAIFQTAAMFVFQKKEKKPPLALTIFFMALYVASTGICFITLESFSFINLFLNALSGIAAILYCLSVSVSSPKTSRLFYVFNPVCWIIYDIPVRAYVNLIVHASVFISTLSALIKTDKIFQKK